MNYELVFEVNNMLRGNDPKYFIMVLHLLYCILVEKFKSGVSTISLEKRGKNKQTKSNPKLFLFSPYEMETTSYTRTRMHTYNSTTPYSMVFFY